MYRLIGGRGDILSFIAVINGQMAEREIGSSAKTHADEYQDVSGRPMMVWPPNPIDRCCGVVRNLINAIIDDILSVPNCYLPYQYSRVFGPPTVHKVPFS